MKEIIILITGVLYLMVVPLTISQLRWLKILYDIIPEKPVTAMITNVCYKGSKKFYNLECTHKSTKIKTFADRKLGDFKLYDLVPVYVLINKIKNGVPRVVTLKYVIDKVLSYILSMTAIMVLCTLIYGAYILS